MRVVLADDETLLREGLTRLIAEAGFDVVGTAGDAAGLLRLIETRAPEVALTDIKMPPNYSEEGLLAAQEIRRRFSPKTVEGHVNNILRKLDIGATPSQHRRVIAVLTFLRARGAP